VLKLINKAGRPKRKYVVNSVQFYIDLLPPNIVPICERLYGLLSLYFILLGVKQTSASDRATSQLYPDHLMSQTGHKLIELCASQE
jgi:hypothetical protein